MIGPSLSFSCVSLRVFEPADLRQDYQKSNKSVLGKYFIFDMNRITNQGNHHIPISGEKLLPSQRLVEKERE